MFNMQPLTLVWRIEMLLSRSWPLGIRSMDCMGPSWDKTSQWLLVFSFCKNSRSWCGDTGIQTVVDALKTMPGGTPELPELFHVISFVLSTSCTTSHSSTVEQMPEQKPRVIRCASFTIFFLPAGDNAGKATDILIQATLVVSSNHVEAGMCRSYTWMITGGGRRQHDGRKEFALPLEIG